ncbi:putative reverse transcriptase domain-containing protein [Tanacetum coccineum]
MRVIGLFWGAEVEESDKGIVSMAGKRVNGLEHSDLGFRYKIEIASGQLVEIDKVIKGCKLEIEGHVFDIDLIPFGQGSFDVIIGMYWLSNYKEEIICHEKVVRIPLPDGKVLRVLGERPEEKARLLMIWIELIRGATPVAKSPYRLTPSEIGGVVGQLKESETKIHSTKLIPWGELVSDMNNMLVFYKDVHDYRN